MYKSGDFGLLREDENIEFIKRKDKQVIIKGKGVQLIEVENEMYRFKKINGVVVKLYLDSKNYSYNLKVIV